jgi:hypothetical protein
MINESGAHCGMRIGRGNQSTRRYPVPVPLCPPQTGPDLWKTDQTEIEPTNFTETFASLQLREVSLNFWLL